MKAIKLKIKGVNSFSEEQTIDFEKLTEDGLFGIFGPTGSGKSTVLDGITLALYGKVARNSSNYINTNCSSASVAFDFEISGANPKRYRVEREFKTDKKSGKPRSGKCKIVDVTNGEPMVLADSVGEVTATCEEIIGLNIEDFTRTVVLPQGKFSEFLKLEGTKRREMLERLFNLQKYGDDLARKLTMEISKEKNENNVLVGELKGYEDINEEIKNSKEQEFNEIKAKYKEASDSLEDIKKVFTESEEIWNLQIELEEHREKEKELEDQEATIEEKKERIILAESAEKVIPYINAYDKTQGDLKEKEKKLEQLNNTLQSLKKEKETVLEAWEMANNDKEDKLPSLRLKEQELKYALDEKLLIDDLQEQINKINKSIETLEEKQSILNLNISELETKEATLKAEITEVESKQDTLKTDSELKEKVQQGLRVNERISEYAERQKQLTLNIYNLNKDIAKDKKSEIKLNNILKDKKDQLTSKENILKEMVAKSPGDITDLVNLQKELSACKEIWSKYTAYITDIEDSKEKIKKLNIQLENDESQRSELEKNIDEIRIKIKEQEIENLALKLRESLTNGGTCPVCGSTHHEKVNIKHIDTEGLESLEEDLKLKEDENKEIVKRNLSTEAELTLLSNNIKKQEESLKLLGEDFKVTTPAELNIKFNNLQNAINKYSETKSDLENEIILIKEAVSNLSKDITKVTTTISQNEKQLVKEINDNDRNNDLLEKAQLDFETLSKETGVTNFEEKNLEIIKMEKEYEQLILKIKELRTDLEKATDEKVNFENEFNKDKELLVSNKVSLKEKEKNKDEKIQNIKNKVEDINNIQGELKDVQIKISQIEKNFKHCEEVKEKIQNKYKDCNDKVIEVSSAVNQLKTQLALDEENLTNSLKRENYTSVIEVNENILSEVLLNEMKTSIEQHYDAKSKIKGAIETVDSKLKGRNIEQEGWESIKAEKKNKELECEVLNKETIQLEQQLKNIKDKLIKLGDLLKKKEKIDHKLGLLSDLENLFKGKRFVEFVATTRLKYVSIEASKRLKEITNGSYGLEVNQDGKFIIRDYKNGGAERDASTLSGGETFIASLALALALSAEIQLKGTAPLELFFLDEGFGTLDDDLLEVVMSSLEKIHNDKLKIGLISHVESIKNRVPIKLILTPAVSGMGGSKVKIEKS